MAMKKSKDKSENTSTKECEIKIDENTTITKISYFPLKKKTGALLGNFSICINDCVYISNCVLCESKGKYWMNYPQSNYNNEYHDIAFITSKDARNEIVDFITENFD